MAKLSFGLWGDATAAAKTKMGHREAEGGRERGFSDSGRRGEGASERERELVMTGNRRWSCMGAARARSFPPLSIAPCCLPSFFPPCSSTGTERECRPSERERDRTKCTANRSIRLGQKGELLSSCRGRKRTEGGRSAESPTTAAPPPTNLSLDKKRKAPRWSGGRSVGRCPPRNKG